MNPEAKLEKHLFEKVRALGGFALKLPAARKAGIPDRLVLLPGGLTYLVELKTSGGSVLPIQREIFRRLDGMGHPVHVLFGQAGIDFWLSTIPDPPENVTFDTEDGVIWGYVGFEEVR